MQQLLSDFEFADINKWEEQVLKDLGLENIEQFTQKLSNEFNKSPYSDHTSDLDLSLQASYRNCTYNAGESWQGARHWLCMERMEGPNQSQLNHLALTALKGGADGVILAPQKKADWKMLLAGISLPDCNLGIEGSMSEITAVNSLLNSSKTSHKGFYFIKNLDECLVKQIQNVVELLSENTGFRALVINEPTEQTGSLIELTLLLSQGIFTINTLIEAGIPISTIRKNLQISLKIGPYYLWEICRLRCLRILFDQVLQQYDPEEEHSNSLTIHVQTSDITTAIENDSRDSAQKNSNQCLISNTTQAMSAVLGGCDILTVLPYQQGFKGEPTSSRRIARNITHILKEESKLHLVADPVAGSYYLEALTDKIMRKVWAALQLLEGKGGYLHHRNSSV